MNGKGKGYRGHADRPAYYDFERKLAKEDAIETDHPVIIPPDDLPPLKPKESKS